MKKYEPSLPNLVEASSSSSIIKKSSSLSTNLSSRVLLGMRFLNLSLPILPRDNLRNQRIKIDQTKFAALSKQDFFLQELPKLKTQIQVLIQLVDVVYFVNPEVRRLTYLKPFFAIDFPICFGTSCSFGVEQRIYHRSST